MPFGYQSVYGKSVPSISSRSHDSNACCAAGLPISPLWPTSNRLSRSRPSLALSVSTIGAPEMVGEREHLLAGVSRAAARPGSVTLADSSIAAAASASWDSSGTTGTWVRAKRGARSGASSPATSPGTVSTETPGRSSARWIACSSICGSCAGLVTVRQYSATSQNTASLSTSWKKSEPSSASGTWPQIASTGACDFLAS